MISCFEILDKIIHSCYVNNMKEPKRLIFGEKFADSFYNNLSCLESFEILRNQTYRGIPFEIDYNEPFVRGEI